MSNFRAQMPGKRSFPRCVRGCEWPPKPWKSEESAETETGTLTLNFKFFRVRVSILRFCARVGSAVALATHSQKAFRFKPRVLPLRLRPSRPVETKPPHPHRHASPRSRTKLSRVLSDTSV